MTILNADSWLYSKLTGDATLKTYIDSRVYVDIAPAKTTYPFIVITPVSLISVTEMSVERVMDNELWQVSIFTDKPSYSTLGTIADQVRSVLHKSTGTNIIGCAFEGARRMSYVEEGRVYKQIILDFRLFTK